MKFSLDTTIVEPLSGKKPKNIIILLHGYGGDGKDISLLTLNWKRFLPDTVFLCPNGFENCSINPSGFQWFDLSNEDEQFILEQSLVAEKKLTMYISEVKEFYKLNNSDICLSGFSQGCMMCINIINKKNLLNRIRSKPKMFLLHGDKDNTVLPTHLLDAKEFFFKNDYKIKTKLLKNCEHHISIQASSLGLEFVKKNLYI